MGYVLFFAGLMVFWFGLPQLVHYSNRLHARGVPGRWYVPERPAVWTIRAVLLAVAAMAVVQLLR